MLDYFVFGYETMPIADQQQEKRKDLRLDGEKGPVFPQLKLIAVHLKLIKAHPHQSYRIIFFHSP